MIKSLEPLAQVVSMKCKPEQKSPASSQKALFSGFKEHRHGVKALHWGFKRKSFMPDVFHKFPYK